MESNPTIRAAGNGTAANRSMIPVAERAQRQRAVQGSIPASAESDWGAGQAQGVFDGEEERGDQENPLQRGTEYRFNGRDRLRRHGAESAADRQVMSQAEPACGGRPGFRLKTRVDGGPGGGGGHHWLDVTPPST